MDKEYNYHYRYPHAAITADCVIFGFNEKAMKILLIERGNEPYLGYWALPGGFMRIDETIEECASRELREETNLNNVYIDQFRVYSRVNRDPRERVVTVAFIALVKPEDYNVIAGDDAAKAMWFDENMLPPLAFDHREIILDAREYLKEILRLKPIAFELLSKTFSISELQTIYEVINQTSYDRRNFLRTAIDSEVISEIKSTDTTSGGRPSKLYTAKYDIITPSTSEDENVSKKRFMSFEKLMNNSETTKPYEEIQLRGMCSLLENKLDNEIKRKKAPTKGLFDFITKKTSH
ncbi:MAG: NUDIX hydrolase [Muribaculaceae bacterium]|nr:NUDIX hydrolase [Muribaculaceae bacterium]